MQTFRQKLLKNSSWSYKTQESWEARFPAVIQRWRRRSLTAQRVSSDGLQDLQVWKLTWTQERGALFSCRWTLLRFMSLWTQTVSADSQKSLWTQKFKHQEGGRVMYPPAETHSEMTPTEPNNQQTRHIPPASVRFSYWDLLKPACESKKSQNCWKVSSFDLSVNKRKSSNSAVIQFKTSSHLFGAPLYLGGNVFHHRTRLMPPEFRQTPSQLTNERKLMGKHDQQPPQRVQQSGSSRWVTDGLFLTDLLLHRHIFRSETHVLR